ncbi:MAG: ISKra4 family transposase [Actinomycetota bacterium]|nr:ISKra4 family transposase [Actinomycetota bacterium]
MSTARRAEVEAGRFSASRERFATVLAFLDGAEAAAASHAELEDRLQVESRELFRQLYQDHLDLRAVREHRVAVVGADGVARSRVETGHTRALTTVFGTVDVARTAYRAPRRANLHPADAALNLPSERHSHGLRRLAAVETTRGSFDDVVEAVERTTGQQVGKRQLEGLAGRAAIDVEAFYAERKPPPGASEDLLVLSCDGKGIVMRPDALRPATAAAAAKTTPKLATRLSKGEKRNRKRMAEVGTVYDAAPAVRTPADILPTADDEREPAPGPVTKNKWLLASVVEDAASVVGQIFAEAQRRDPTHARTWVALVDGNNHQIDRIAAEARAREVPVAITIDFIHVLEYVWKAAWCFFAEGDQAAEAWVHDKARAVLAGRATRVAGAIRRQATTAGLEPARRAGADTCAGYLTKKAPHLDYPRALANGWPIATGVIEGACRHLVKDRMDITGARWGLAGAETILKLRAVRSNGDFEKYWDYHLSQERRRVHQSLYADNLVPQAA